MANVNKIKQMAERHEYNLAVDILDSQDLERSLNPQFLRSCAEIYENVGRLKEARQLYIKAHSMAPVANRIIFSIINFYLKRGFSSLAARYYEEYEANDTGLSGDFSEANYIMKKAVPVDLSVLHDMLYPRFRDQMDENWSFELFLVLCLMGKREEYMILGSDYLATFKEGLYNQAIQDILLGDEKAETYFYIYPKDEVPDKDPEEEDIRSREIEVLKADYLRRNPQNSEAYITEMYDDEKPAPKFRNKKKKSSAEPEYDENGNLIEPENGEVDEATRSRNEAVERRLKSFIRKKFLKGKAAAKTDDNTEEAAMNPDGTAAETAMAGTAAATDAATAGIAASAEGAAAVNASAEGTAVDQTDASGTTETKSENVGATEFIKGIFNIRPTGTNKSDMKEIKPEKEFISYDFDDGFAPESESIYDLDKEEEEAFENPFDSISAYKELERYKQNAELDFRKAKESAAAENEVEEEPVVEEAGYGTEETSYPVSVPASYEEEYTSEYEDSDEYSDFDYSDIDEEYLSVTTEFISSLTDEELASMTDEELAAAIEKVFAPKIEDRSKFNDLSEPFYEVGKESSEETDTESAEEIHKDSSYDEEAELIGEEPRYDEEAELVGEEPRYDEEAELVGEEPRYDEEAELVGEEPRYDEEAELVGEEPRYDEEAELVGEEPRYDEEAELVGEEPRYDEEAELVGEEPRYDEEAELVGEEPQQDKEAEPEYDEEAELIGEPILSSGFDYTSLFGKELEREKASESDVTADQTSTVDSEHTAYNTSAVESESEITSDHTSTPEVERDVTSDYTATSEVERDVTSDYTATSEAERDVTTDYTATSEAERDVTSDYTSTSGAERDVTTDYTSTSEVETAAASDYTSASAVESDVTDSYTYVEESADETSSGTESESSPISEHEIKVDVDIDSDNGFEAEFDTEAEAEEDQDEDSTYSYSFKSSPEFSTIIGFDSEQEFKQQLQSELESIDKQKPEPEPEPKEEPKPEPEPEVKTSIKYGLKTPFGTGSVFGTGTKSEPEPVFGSGPSFGTEEKITFGPGLRPSFSSEDKISFKRETDSSVKPSAETVVSEPLAEPEIKSETETVMESASETVKESVTETVFESTSEILTETKSDTFGSPVTEEVTEPSVEVTVEPETQIYEKPEAEAYDEPKAYVEPEAEVIEESEDTVIIEPDIDDVIEAPSEGGTADVYEGETEPAYLMVKPRFEFPEFKTDLFPAVRQNFDIENKFDDIVNEKQSELDAKLKAEDEKMREAQELLASLGIEI